MNYRQEMVPEVHYHLYNRTVGAEQPLQSPEEIHNLLDRFKRLSVPYVEVLSYAVLANHYHFIVRVKPIDREQIR